MPGPSDTLSGLRVLDLTRNLAGPFCTMILGDLGADVVKIEAPGGGDDTRSWIPPAWGGESATFLSANRNKRSVVVNIDDPEGLEIIRSLARRADVLVESFRPGSLDKRGLGYDALSKENPAIVYCSISAFGGTGPQRDSPGYDPVLQAYTGIMSMTGEPDQPPVRLGIGALDLGAGLWATIGILSALSARRSNGQGCRVETSLFELGTWWLSYHLSGYLASGIVPERQGTKTAFIAPYEVFETADGELFVAAPNDNLFIALTEALHLPGLAADGRFATNSSRVAHRDDLHRLIEERLRDRSATEWESLLTARSIPCSRVRTVADLAHDEHLAALGMLTSIPHPAIPDLRVVDMPMTLAGQRPAHRLPPPRLGEHTSEVLGELGYTDAEVVRLRAKGVVS